MVIIMETKVPFKVCVVEDDEFYGDLLEYNLTKESFAVVDRYKDSISFLNNFNEQLDLITLDYNLPDITCEALIEKIRNVNDEIPIVVITGLEDVGTAVKLLKQGIYDYIMKDENTKDRLFAVIKNIKENLQLKGQIDALKDEIGRKFDLKHKIIGESTAIKKVFKLIEKGMSSNITISIAGETGTGKEVVAKAIHYNSSRKNKPFVPVNITAIPNDLIESELFGHEKGAFTGAIARRTGKFEEAANGTIFLDEIGEMDINMQTKLLRILQERELTRVGGNEIVKIKSRVIVATHKDLGEEVRLGKFRQDLYYRLLGLPIYLPPLRERENDIILLAKYFINLYCEENNKPLFQLSMDAQNKLLKYNWPGNIRELKAVVELACVMTDSNLIDHSHLTFDTQSSLENLLKEEMSLKEYSNNIIKYFMKKYNNDVVMVSRKLKIGKSTIYRLIQQKQI